MTPTHLKGRSPRTLMDHLGGAEIGQRQRLRRLTRGNKNQRAGERHASIGKVAHHSAG